MGNPSRPPLASPRRPGRPRWHRHSYPMQFIGWREELLMALLFGIVGLLVTGVLMLNADAVVCAIGTASTDCEAPPTTVEE